MGASRVKAAHIYPYALGTTVMAMLFGDESIGELFRSVFCYGLRDERFYASLWYPFHRKRDGSYRRSRDLGTCRKLRGERLEESLLEPGICVLCLLCRTFAKPTTPGKEMAKKNFRVEVLYNPKEDQHYATLTGPPVSPDTATPVSRDSSSTASRDATSAASRDGTQIRA
jgi:hypothetical protein